MLCPDTPTDEEEAKKLSIENDDETEGLGKETEEDRKIIDSILA